jgi:hypothetical protein
VSSTPEPPAPRDHALAKFRWPITVVIVAGLIVIAVVLVVKEVKNFFVEGINAAGKQSTNLVHSLGQEAANALARFNQGTITRTFEESLPKLSSEPGGRLELASLTQTESFTESNNLVTGWGKLDLGSTVTEIKVPATYRYYLRLHDKWELDVQTNICIVHAPRFHPTLPPAIDTGRMEKKSVEGWGRFNAAEQMTQLEKDITPTLAVYAGDKRHLDMVREECRKNVAQFVRDWLLKEDQWRDDRFSTIKVVFADENQTNVLTIPPTLELKLK